MKEHEGIDYLFQRLRETYQIEQYQTITKAMEEKRVVSLRVNTLKSSVEDVILQLEFHQISYQQIEWYKDAFIVDALEVEIESLDLYKKGHIYLQSLSSMIPPLVLNPKEHKDILDMAAAPGGKTTELAALTQNKSSIMACEASPIRAEKLKFNLIRQGTKNVNVIIKDARKLDEFFRFDYILLDAPCSGSGTIELNDEKTYRHFSKKLVDKSVALQRELLQKAISLLKTGQEMVYSTCSILQEENEMIISWILKTGKIELVPIEDKMFNNISTLPTKIKGTILIPPSRYYEGFFIAKLKKK